MGRSNPVWLATDLIDPVWELVWLVPGPLVVVSESLCIGGYGVVFDRFYTCVMIDIDFPYDLPSGN